MPLYNLFLSALNKYANFFFFADRQPSLARKVFHSLKIYDRKEKICKDYFFVKSKTF